MHAFAFLKELGSSDACGDRGYFSIGPCAPGTSCLFFDSLASFTNPQPQQKEHSFFSFQSADGQDTSALAAASLDTDDEVDDRGVLVFSIVDAAPSNTSRALPRLAPRISQVDSLIISRVPVLGFDIAKKEMQVAFGNMDGTESEDLYVLTSNTLTMKEMKSMIRWECQDGLRHSCGVSVSASSQPFLDDVLQGLIRAHASRPGVVAEFHMLDSDIKRNG